MSRIVTFAGADACLAALRGIGVDTRRILRADAGIDTMETLVVGCNSLPGDGSDA